MGNTVITPTNQVFSTLSAKRLAVKNSLKNLPIDERSKLTDEYNADARRYNFLTQWGYLIKRYADGQGWCSYRNAYHPAEDEKPFLVLRIERVQIIGRTDHTESAALYLTPSLQLRNEKIGGEFADARLPVVLVGDPPERTMGDLFSEPTSLFFGQHPVWLDHAKCSIGRIQSVFPDDIPDDEAERYSIPPLLELILSG